VQALLTEPNCAAMAPSLRAVRLWHKAVSAPGFGGGRSWKTPQQPAPISPHLKALASLEHLALTAGGERSLPNTLAAMPHLKALVVEGLLESSELASLGRLCPRLEHLSAAAANSEGREGALSLLGRSLCQLRSADIDLQGSGRADWAWLEPAVERGQLEWVRLSGEGVTAELVAAMVQRCKVRREGKGGGGARLGQPRQFAGTLRRLPALLGLHRRGLPAGGGCGGGGHGREERRRLRPAPHRPPGRGRGRAGVRRPPPLPARDAAQRCPLVGLPTPLRLRRRAQLITQHSFHVNKTYFAR
jgi:hypothetical protein